MKAIEVTGKIDSQRNLVLDEPIEGTTYPHQVRVIVLVPEPAESEEFDPDDTPVEEIKASLREPYSKQKQDKLDQLASYGTGLMQSDGMVSIRFSDEFEEKLYRLSKRFRNIRSDVQPIVELVLS